MIPAFVIHSLEQSDREDIVQDIIKKTKATVIPAIMIKENGTKGCTLSHIEVAKMAKDAYPEQSYLVFEDDCILKDGWESVLEENQDCDLIYLGYNGLCEHTIFGTHALYITPKMRDFIIEYAEQASSYVRLIWAYDHILSLLSQVGGFKICIPKEKDKYAYQKPGLKSYITGNIRE